MNTSTDSCLYFECTSSKENRDKNVSFFKLPIHSKELCKIWLVNCGRYDSFRNLLQIFNKEKLLKFIICEKHFEAKDIMVNNRRKLLFRNAIPTPCEGPVKFNFSTPKPAPPPVSVQVQDSTLNQQPVIQRCSVAGCNNESRPGGQYQISDKKIISFFLFPYPNLSNFDRLPKWLENLGIDRKEFIWREDKYVCSEHFRTEAFSIDQDGKTIKLLPDAVPIRKEGVNSSKDSSKIEVVSSFGLPQTFNTVSSSDPCPQYDFDASHVYCVKCRKKQKSMTTKEKKIVKYYYNKMIEYHSKYQRQVRLYTRKINEGKTRKQSLEKELKNLTKKVEAMRNPENNF